MNNNQSLSPEKIEELKSQHGDVFVITGEVDHEVEMNFYFRKPNRTDLSRFTKEVTGDIWKASNNLVFGTLLYPESEVVVKLINDKPGLVLALAAELQKIIGSNQDFLSMKL